MTFRHLKITGGLIFAGCSFIFSFMNCTKDGGTTSAGAVSASSLAGTISLSPATQTVAPSAKQQMQVFGGTPPYFYNVIPQFMGVIDQNGIYSAPSQAGIAFVSVTDASGQVASATLTIATSAPRASVVTSNFLGALTDIQMTPPGSHGSVGCPDSYSASGGIADSDPGGIIDWLVFFCNKSDPAATKVVSDVFVTQPADNSPPACPAGYQTGQPIVDCESSVGYFCAAWQYQNLCFKTDSIQNLTSVVMSLYVQFSPDCNPGDTAVGQTTNCNAFEYCPGGAQGTQAYCVQKLAVPR